MRNQREEPVVCSGPPTNLLVPFPCLFVHFRLVIRGGFDKFAKPMWYPTHSVE